MHASWNDIIRQIWLLVISPSICCLSLDPAVTKSSNITSSDSSINQPRHLNDECFLNSQCQAFDSNSECDTLCRCKKNYGIVVTKTNIVCRPLHAEPPPPSALGDRCKTSKECINHVDKNSECFKKEFKESEYGKCVCREGTDILDGKCISSVDPDFIRQEEYFQSQPADFKFAIIIVISTIIIFVLIFIGIGFLKLFLPCMHPPLQNQCMQVHMDPSRTRTANTEVIVEDNPPSYIELMKHEMNTQSPPPAYTEIAKGIHSPEQKQSSERQLTCHHCHQSPAVVNSLNGQTNTTLNKY